MSKIDVNTSFNVNLSLNANTLGRRIIAYIIDFILLVIYFFFSFWLAFKIMPSDVEDAGQLNAGILSLITLPMIMFTLIFEFISGGYTPGKFLLGIRVVKINGYKPEFVDYFIRWIFRAVEIYTFLILSIVFESSVLMGLFSMLWGTVAVAFIAWKGKGQRIGDLIAGTSVVRVKQMEDINITIHQHVNESYKPVITQVIRFSDNDMRIIKDTYRKCKESGDYDTIAVLRTKMEKVMNFKSDLLDDEFFATVIKDFNYYTQK